MVLTGMKVSAEEALGMGLVHAVFAKDTLQDEALGLANKIAGHAPVALEYAKETIRQGHGHDFGPGPQDGTGPDSNPAVDGGPG